MMYDDELHQRVLGHMADDLGPEQGVSRGSVNYREANSQDRSCLTCVNFFPDENACRVVGGEVSAGGLCDRFEMTDESTTDEGDDKDGYGA